MTDSFHRSLDRALDHDPHTDWGVGSDALTDLLAARNLMEAQPPQPLPDSWQNVGWIDETWEPRDLRPMMDAINRSVVSMARARDYFTIDGTTAYDGVEVAIEWREPVIRPLEFTASIETIELLCGTSLIPLCERQIPAEGTE